MLFLLWGKNGGMIISYYNTSP
ncbi:CLUMA_CG009478, isoform A [Clunio marinus]|uniref:CLUMA_CG009478, isoform A n=1 Tax=Clunio marinus TaxID=568069 RepID=A0A1J1IC81_9DIPT|nr:CLUMA_CG009478, isoform A [Clunio marinus]